MKAPSLKPLVQCGVVAVGGGFESLPASEQGTILASQSEAWRRLALTRSGYNASKGQKSPDTPFDAEEFVFRSSRGQCLSREAREAIVRAMDGNDREFFIRLGKRLQAMRNRPPSDDWGTWLVDHWVNQENTSMPSLCTLTPAVLAEVVAQCGASTIGTGAIEKRIRDLGLKRAKALKLAVCGRYKGERVLYLATSPEALKRYARSKGRRSIIELVV